CILCGLCVEACPTRALTMTNEYEIADDSRENLIWTKEQLLAPLESGMEPPPHPMRLGDTQRDYYLLRSAGASAAKAQYDEAERSVADWIPGAPRHEGGSEPAAGAAAGGAADGGAADDGSEAVGGGAADDGSEAAGGGAADDGSEA